MNNIPESVVAYNMRNMIMMALMVIMALMVLNI